MNFTNYEEMAAMILFGIGFTTLLPVSYTHLDVYKRQRQRFAD